MLPFLFPITKKMAELQNFNIAKYSYFVEKTRFWNGFPLEFLEANYRIHFLHDPTWKVILLIKSNKQNMLREIFSLDGYICYNVEMICSTLSGCTLPKILFLKSSLTIAQCTCQRSVWCRSIAAKHKIADCHFAIA